MSSVIMAFSSWFVETKTARRSEYGGTTGLDFMNGFDGRVGSPRGHQPHDMASRVVSLNESDNPRLASSSFSTSLSQPNRTSAADRPFNFLACT